MTLLRRHVSSGLVLSLLGAAIVAAVPQRARAEAAEQGTDVVVFAAASLKNALDAANSQWQTDTGKKVVVSYAATSALAKQIEQGGPANVFIAADLEWMDYLAKKDLIDPASRSNLFGNRLVLIAPKGKASPLEIKTGFDLAKVVGDGRLAVGQVESVPAGKYAKAALSNLGVWDSVAGKLAQTENVRAALALVALGEAAAGIVYQTDAAADKAVEIIGAFPEDSHPPIIYPGALTMGGANENAASLLNFLKSEKAKPFFEAQGFTILR